jgi:hypothetical protein
METEMEYKINIFLLQDDSTGNNPIIDVKWNEETVISSYTISKKFNLNNFQESEKIYFITSNMQTLNKLEILYINKNENDSTNEDKVLVTSIISSEGYPDPDYDITKEKIYSETETQNSNYPYVFYSFDFWIWNEVTVDGEVLSKNLDTEVENPFYTIAIKNTNLVMNVNYPPLKFLPGNAFLGPEENNIHSYVYNNIPNRKCNMLIN